MITKEKFLAFTKVQKSGQLNMTDIVRGAALAGLTEDEYTDIIWHFSQYRKQFLDK